MILNVDMDKYRAQVQRLFRDVLNEKEMEDLLRKSVKASIRKTIPNWEGLVREKYALRSDESSKKHMRVTGFNTGNGAGSLIVNGYSRALTRADYGPKYADVRRTGKGSFPRPQARNETEEGMETLAGGPRKINKKGPALLAPFVVRFKTGHEAIVSRVQGKGRFPLKERKAIPIPYMFGNEDVREKAMSDFWEFVDEAFAWEMVLKAKRTKGMIVE